MPERPLPPVESSGPRGVAEAILRNLNGVRCLALAVGDHVEIEGRLYAIGSDRIGGVTIELPITPVAELDEQQGTKPASAEDFERLTASNPSVGEG